jgi:hypothetical protein
MMGAYHRTPLKIQQEKLPLYLVNIPPVPNLYHDDLQDIIQDFIDDAIDPLAKPIPFLAGQFLAPCGAGVFRQLLEALQDAMDVFSGEGPKIPGHGFLEGELISFHVP